LLGKLANGFVSDVVVQCPAIVAANVVEPAPPGAQPLPPRLFGGLGIELAELSPSPAKLDLLTATSAAPELLTFVLSASFPSGDATPESVPVPAGACHSQVSNLEPPAGALDR